MPELMAWDSFYVIVGSSAAALTGLMFVVATLIAQVEVKSPRGTFAAFATPTIVHFCETLLVSAALSAPWPTLWGVGAFLDACGVGGVAYCMIVVRRTRRQTGYTPVLEDWMWHAILPHIAYFLVIGGGLTVARYPTSALFAIAVATIGLIFIGIHNAWDSVTYLAIEYRSMPRKDEH